ncbi:F-box protein [Sesamum angolense]|uniref:F-box protein n=1 Tax=Sesamum angolense TaxID=2727404 RepID=A0AAE1W1R0_9LAMI|nr:F-box protein [Sesamum angolense]
MLRLTRAMAIPCRRVRFLSLEGCSLLTTHGLESVIISWNELQTLEVKSCNNIKDTEANPTLSTVFSALKDLKWKPDSKSQLSSNLEGTGMGKRGSKFLKKSCDWKSLPMHRTSDS